MGRNPEIDKILLAWWELDNCAPPERAKSESALHQLLDAVIVKSHEPLIRQQILNALWPRYKEYRVKMHSHEKVQVAQSALKKS